MRWDCHIHMVLDGLDWKAAIARHAQKPDDQWIRQILSGYQARGYRYLRDGGDRWGVGAHARALAPEYGITYRTPLSPLYKIGHYGRLLGTGFETMKDYQQLVCRMREEGADFIKVMISGLMDFDRFGVLTEEGLAPEEIREMISIAHAEGMSVMAHANGARTVQAAAEAGVDSVEHGAYLDREALEAMVQGGTVWVPTLSTFGNLRGTGRFDEGAVQAILDSALENVRQFSCLGGLLAPGSDAGAWSVPHDADSEGSLLRLALGSRTDDLLGQGAQAIAVKF